MADIKIPENCIGTYTIENFFYICITLNNLRSLSFQIIGKQNYNSSESYKSNNTSEGKVIFQHF